MNKSIIKIQFKENPVYDFWYEIIPYRIEKELFDWTESLITRCPIIEITEDELYNLIANGYSFKII